jgi:hypothetical protein
MSNPFRPAGQFSLKSFHKLLAIEEAITGGQRVREQAFDVLPGDPKICYWTPRDVGFAFSLQNRGWYNGSQRTTHELPPSARLN